jgi:hypothetical protein
MKNDIRARMGDRNARITETNARISDLNTHMDLRFDETKDLWRSELHGVKGVLDARLKHIEER